MRLNKYIASATGLSRRAADEAVSQNRVRVNGAAPTPGQDIVAGDSVIIDGRAITPAVNTQTVMLNKPAGYVVSRDGQGSRTIYDLMPASFHHLKPVGRLDKDSSGLLLLTSDGQLAQQLTHPSHQKTKVYEVTLTRPLEPADRQRIHTRGVELDDGLSRLQLSGQGSTILVTMHEGRNRQIRRTFTACGYTVARLHRTGFGPYTLGQLKAGEIKAI